MTKKPSPSIEGIKIEARTIAAKYEAWARMDEQSRPDGLKVECRMKIHCPDANWVPYHNDLMVEAIKYGVRLLPPVGVVVADHAVLNCIVERV